MSSQRGQMSHSNANMSAADMEAANRARYMSHMERRARPPTFRPLTIVVVVLSIGLFVIGLIMIVIAHWPGVSGGESLKIAGGVLIAIGGLVFIIAMAVTCVLRNREQQRFEKSIANIAASRSQPYMGLKQNQGRGNMSVISRPTMQTTPTPSLEAKPGRSILKKTPSTSTYGTNRGSVFGEESDSGIPGQNHSYERDSDLSNTSSGKYEVYRIETLPDPGQARKGRNGALPQAPRGAGSLGGSGAGLGGHGLAGSGLGAGMEQSSTDSEAQYLPTPVRNTRKRRGQSPSVASNRQNTSYAGEGDISRDQTQPPAPAPAPAADSDRHRLQSYSNEGYDVHEGDAPRQQKSRHRDGTDATPESEERERRRQRRAKKAAAADPSAVNVSVGSGAGLGAGVPSYQPAAFQNEAFQPQEADLGYSPPQVQHTVTTTTTRHVTRRDPRINTSQLSSSLDDELKINIKAQPGTAVHITPTGTRKYKPARTVASPSQSSVETEI